MKNLRWPRLTWVRETLIILMEYGWESVPAWVMQEIIEYSKGPFSTYIVEILFNGVRRYERKNGSGKCAPDRSWNTCMTAGVLEVFKRSLVPVTPEARAAAGATLPDGVFHGSVQGCTLNDETRSTLTATSWAWQSLSPENVRLGGLLWACAKHFAGNWSRMETAFWSLTITPGMLVWEESSRYGTLVLRNSAFGFIGYRVTLHKVCGKPCSISRGEMLIQQYRITRVWTPASGRYSRLQLWPLGTG